MSDELFQAIENEASIEEVKRILEKHPEAITVKDNVGYLPLHFALRCKASHEIVEMLLKANPEAIKVQDVVITRTNQCSHFNHDSRSYFHFCYWLPMVNLN